MQKISTFFIVAFFLCSVLNISAQTLPAGTTNRGTDFWLSFPVSFSAPSSANALKIYVSCEVATRCTLEIPGLGIFMVKNTVPNGIIEFSLDPGMGQPYQKSDSITGAMAEQVFSKRGIHVSAPVPISVYGVSRFANTSDSYVALPTSALGREYIVASYADATGNIPNQHLMSQTIIVAAHDNTTVSFTLGGSAGTQTVGGMKVGQTKIFALKKGDVLAYANRKIDGVYGDLSGSRILSNKPVAVISGNQCASVDVTTPACDFIMEMELPTMSWGKEYHITKIQNRKKYSFLKIFAKEPNTKLYREGSSTPFAVLSTAGGRAGAGYYEGRVLDDGSSPHPVIIKADKPISITQYNTGGTDDNVSSAPFQMALTPVEQYQREITFTTPNFQVNYVNLVFEGNSDGSIPDDLEFGTVNFKNEVEWQPIQTVFGFTAEPFKTFAGDTKKYFQKTLSLSANRVIKIRALKPFAAYQYGYDAFDSYGHPAAVSVRDFTVNDTIRPLVSFTIECGGRINDGKAEDLPNNDSLRSNLALITLLEGSKNYILEKDEFIAGLDLRAPWKLQVSDQAKPAIAKLYVTDRAGNDTTVIINYTPPTIALDTSIVNFGFLKVEESKTAQFTIRNTSTTNSQTITKVGIKGGKSFSLVNAPAVPILMQPLETRTFDIQFTADDIEGNFRDSILLEINGCINVGAALQARTGSEPSLEITDADFGTVKTNTDAFKTIKLKNLGTFPLTLTGYSGPSKPEFTLTGWPNINPNSPYVLDYQEELRLIVVFNASAEGDYSDEIRFKSNAKIEGTDSIANLSAKAVMTVGIEESQDPFFTISPNPATGVATITLPAFTTQNVFLKIFDTAGNEVIDFSKDLLKTELRFDTKTLPNGAYFLRFTDGKTMLSRSFIIQN